MSQIIPCMILKLSIIGDILDDGQALITGAQQDSRLGTLLQNVGKNSRESVKGGLLKCSIPNNGVLSWYEPLTKK